MRIHRLKALFVAIPLILSSVLPAQQEARLTAEEINAYVEQCRQMVNYLEGTLNFLGDPEQVPADKDIIINQSYLKIFQSDETQVEDDLDPGREMALNKDVQAYLKDVDFFFRQVEFNFDINKVEQLVNEKGQVFFKVTFSRNLSGITINNDTINNNLVRYMEINLDLIQQDLKIASLYTTKPDVRQELNYWWVNLDDSWKAFLGDSVFLYRSAPDTLDDAARSPSDTITLSRVLAFNDSLLVTGGWEEDYRIDSFMVYKGDTLDFYGLADSLFYLGDTLIDSTIHYLRVYDTIPTDGRVIYQKLEQIMRWKTLDISGNRSLTHLNPVSILSDLVSIDFSDTDIDDLSPLRNLNKLEVINCRRTPVKSLDPLRYSSNLKQIDCSHSAVTDIGVLSFLNNLTSLSLDELEITNLSPLAGLGNLNRLRISGVKVYDLSPLEGHNNLSDLNISGTAVTSLESVGKLSNLQSLNIDSTYVTRLDPLKKLEKLSSLQANSSRITLLDPLSGMKAIKFIYCDNTGIDAKKAADFMEQNPQCLVIYNTQEIEQWWIDLPEAYKSIIYARSEISDPITTVQLHQLINLTEVDLSNQQNIETIEPLSMLYRLESLNLENTPVADLSPLEGLNNLRHLNINNTAVNSIMPLRRLQNLTWLACENTEVHELRSLFSSRYLAKVYCDGSGITQKEVSTFRDSLPDCLVIYQSDELSAWWTGLDKTWREEMEKQMDFAGDYGRENLQRLVDLPEVKVMDNSAIRNLEPLKKFTGLKTLTISNTGINNLRPLTGLTKLMELNVPNNPVADLSVITGMQSLTVLNVENSAVEDLKEIGKLTGLKKLNIAGTPIKNLKGLEALRDLEVLFINNTGVKNLKPLEGMKNLKELKCYRTGISSKNIDKYRENNPRVNIEYY